MRGIRLLRLLDVLPVTAAQNAPGVSPRSLLIECDELTAVDQVLMNGVSSPSFTVFSKSRLLAQVPSILDQATITDVAVLSSAASLTRRSLIEFGMGTRVRAQTGAQRLIQTFVRMLLRTPGSNIFHPTLGGGLYAGIGQNITARTAADITMAVSSVRSQIIAAQTQNSAIPASERLLSAEVAGTKEDPANATIYVTLVVTAHDRQRSAATLLS